MTQFYGFSDGKKGPVRLSNTQDLTLLVHVVPFAQNPAPAAPKRFPQTGNAIWSKFSAPPTRTERDRNG